MIYLLAKWFDSHPDITQWFSSAMCWKSFSHQFSLRTVHCIFYPMYSSYQSLKCQTDLSCLSPFPHKSSPNYDRIPPNPDVKGETRNKGGLSRNPPKSKSTILRSTYYFLFSIFASLCSSLSPVPWEICTHVHPA